MKTAEGDDAPVRAAFQGPGKRWTADNGLQTGTLRLQGPLPMVQIETAGKQDDNNKGKGRCRLG